MRPHVKKIKNGVVKNGVASLIFLGVLFLTVSVIILGRNGGEIIWSQKKWTKK